MDCGKSITPDELEQKIEKTRRLRNINKRLSYILLALAVGLVGDAIFRFQWARANAYLFAITCLTLLVMERKTNEVLRLTITQQDITIWNLQHCIDKYITKQIEEE